MTQVTTAGGDADPERRRGARGARRGVDATQLKAEAPVGQLVDRAQLSLSPDWSGLASAIGGGPLLVRNGKPIFQADEMFNAGQLNGRQARGAIGQLANGSIVLVGVEGTKPSYSIGMSSYELAVELSQLGAVTAFGLGAGPAAGVAFNGSLLTRPSTGTTPKVSDALVLSYTGIYAAQPSAPVLSPNGDGVGDTESLAYRVVRPSHVVTATLTGPGGTTIKLADTTQSPGLHTFTWDGTDGGSRTRRKGSGRSPSPATDDRNGSRRMRRARSRSTTRSHRSRPFARARALATATFELTRPAVGRRASRAPERRARSDASLGQAGGGNGEADLARRKTVGGLNASSGRYEIAVQAASAVGKSSLVAPFCRHSASSTWSKATLSAS